MIATFCRLFVLLLVGGLAVSAQAQQPGAMAPASGTPAPASSAPADPAVPLLKQAYELVTKKDLNGALTLVNEAVRDNPKSFASFTLRGMIYSQKKDWTNAESDFNAALSMDPTNVVVKFNLGEIKFVQKLYDAARARFVLLESDPSMGDFATYKVFLCDLFGGHVDVATKELAVFNAAESKPSYYFGNAAWDLFYKKPEDARQWLVSAGNIYAPSKNQFYAASLRDLGYLPLPPPAAQ